MHNVYVIEDDELTRERLIQLIVADKNLQVCGSAGSVRQVEQGWAVASKADVVLVDLGLPDGDGAAVIRRLSALEPAPFCLVISVFGDERRVVQAIEAGACGYLLKDTDEIGIASLILGTLNGECPINPSIARHLLKKFHPEKQSSDVPSPITQRETEVLKMVARGYANAEISELLEMSVHTVTTHTKNIYRKLAVGSRSEAVFEAAQLGLIDLANRTT